MWEEEEREGGGGAGEVVSGQVQLYSSISFLIPASTNSIIEQI